MLPREADIAQTDTREQSIEFERQGYLTRGDDKTYSDSGSASNMVVHSNAIKKNNKNKATVIREYNLRKKPSISSPVHGSITVTLAADTDALASMRMVSSKSWTDQCEEDNFPPKHGVNRGS